MNYHARATSNRGFTLVELLIVIVVIAILAAISIVAYNGIQVRAQVSLAKSDLTNMAKQMELYKVDHGEYPSVMQAPKNDLADILKKAGVYEATRFTDQTSWSNGERPDKRYVFCTPVGDTQRFAIVVDIPFINDSFESVGKTTYYVDQTGGVRELEFTQVSNSIGASLCSIATGLSVDAVSSVWSNAVPSAWSP